MGEVTKEMSDDKAGIPAPEPYTIVRLANGAYSVRSLTHRETFHPVVGPVAEAEALYVKQLKVRERFQSTPGEFVVWDVGLGAAANPVTLLRALHGIPGQVRIISFDFTTAPLSLALQHVDKLGYLAGYERPLNELIAGREVEFEREPGLTVRWRFLQDDFPTLLQSAAAHHWPKPHAILFDAFSPATNPVMWTLPLFQRLFALLDPKRPCALPTYSRSTLLRVTLLLAGFFVGIGHPTGEKEETTIAANTRELIEEPLDRIWLFRARKSTSAEPLHEPLYRQLPLSEASWEALREHPQFAVGEENKQAASS